MAQPTSPAKILGGIAILALAAGIAYFQQRSGHGSGATPAPSSSTTSAAGPAEPVSSTPPAPSTPPAKAPPTPAADPPKDAAPKATSRTAKIGAWNIEWLGKPEDRSGFAKGVAQTPDDVADYIVASGVEILGVCEVVVKQPGRPLRSRELEAAIEVIKKRTGDQWDYTLFPGRSDGDQLTGVMWNRSKATAVSQSGKAWDNAKDTPWALPIPKGRSSQGSGLWNRPPHAMKFSFGDGRTDIVVIMVHMKADYQGKFAAHREEEARGLVAVLPEVNRVFKDSDVVVIGDTNCPEGPEPAIETFAKAGLIDLNTKNAQTHWRGGTMDKALVPKDQPEFAGRIFGVLSDSYLSTRRWKPGDFKRHLSDHYLVTTSVAVGQDDD